MATLALVTGIPRAGKSSLCDAIEAAGVGFTHVPLDRYVLPVPTGQAFLEWIATPACIAWDHLLDHLALLEAGTVCYSPRPAWERGWRTWACAGGALATGPGRRMEPGRGGYLLAGTHAFQCPLQLLPTLRVFVRTPLAVVAERLIGHRVERRAAGGVVRARLASNTAAILRERRRADVIIDGTADRNRQVRRFLEGHATFVAQHRPSASAAVAAAERGGAADEVLGIDPSRAD
jgi:hypothetical protein